VNKRTAKISPSAIAPANMLHGYSRQRCTIGFLSNSRASCYLVFLFIAGIRRDKVHRWLTRSWTGRRVSRGRRRQVLRARKRWILGVVVCLIVVFVIVLVTILVLLVARKSDDSRCPTSYGTSSLRVMCSAWQQHITELNPLCRKLKKTFLFFQHHRCHSASVTSNY